MKTRNSTRSSVWPPCFSNLALTANLFLRVYCSNCLLLPPILGCGRHTPTWIEVPHMAGKSSKLRSRFWTEYGVNIFLLQVRIPGHFHRLVWKIHVGSVHILLKSTAISLVVHNRFYFHETRSRPIGCVLLVFRMEFTSVRSFVYI